MKKQETSAWRKKQEECVSLITFKAKSKTRLDAVDQVLLQACAESTGEKEVCGRIEKQAKKNNPTAQLIMGQINEFGIGVPGNNEKSIYWYKKAAANGNPHAQYLMGTYYQFVEKNRNQEKAFTFYREAAKNNSLLARHWLAYSAENKPHNKTNKIEAARLYQELCAARESDGSFYDLLLREHMEYLLLIGKAENAVKAQDTVQKNEAIDQWITRESGSGNVMAHFYVYSRFPAMREAVFPRLQQAAGDGNAKAQVLVAHEMMQEGCQKERCVNAMALYKKAALHNEPIAQCALGVAYLEGRGVPEDPEKALFWLKRGASQYYGWEVRRLEKQKNLMQGILLPG